ncbi:DHS-like NAD/FAD-binding domain-containing protein [Rhexocercosporidium sp. MPI-PUGE-AT-0058]|nr:DHS-like NAD/FAD-binding domain-containing protein [Rhexocercosporidium sp. MPI-PUGE-AT-0058]
MAQRIELASLPDYVAHMQLSPLIEAFRKKKRIVVVAGAGISAAAGIPTFDSMTTASTKIFSSQMYRSDKDTKTLNAAFSDMYNRAQAASPTQFHHVLEAIAKEGRLHRLYTQNIDGLDTQLAPLKTEIPLPFKRPWPRTIQLHGDLKTLKCEGDPRHLSRFDPALFGPELSAPLCTECKVHKRTGKVHILRPRVSLYDEYAFPDADAIGHVVDADMRASIDLFVVVGTALKVSSVKAITKLMCNRVHEKDGKAIWINLKAPTKDLGHYFDLVIIGNCEIVARHVSTWWVDIPLVFSDSEIQQLQDRCKLLFIARSPGAAINRALRELDTESLSKIFQQPENKSKILNIKDNGRSLFASAAGSPISSSGGSDRTAVNKSLPLSSKNSDVMPKLLDCWKIDMSKRLSEVVVPLQDGENGTARTSSTIVTKIINLGYKATFLGESLWRLKPGQYLNDEVINAYLELLQRSIASPSQRIADSFTILATKVNRPFKQLLDTGIYSIYLPINQNYHWTFAVITSKSKNDALCWTYYDSLSGEAPGSLLEWIQNWFPNKKTEELMASPNPIQNNGTDCGLFVLMGIRRLIARRSHLTQAESDTLMPLFRERVLAELLASSLDPSESQYRELERKETNVNETPPQGTKDTEGPEVLPAEPDDHHHDNQSELFIPKPEDSNPSGSRRHERLSPEYFASAFAEEATMLDTLREAVAIERVTQKQYQNPTAENQKSTVENQDLAQLWLMVRTEKRALKQRYIHYEFCRQFWAVMKDCGSSPHDRSPVPEATVLKVMDRLEVTDRAAWKRILKRARKASVWTELIDIFKDDLERPSVVLCAVPKATYKLEALTLSHRKAFLDTIRSRLKVPENGILARLRAASSLYWAVINNGLPTGNLQIESANEDLPFEQKVSSRK